MGGLNPGVVCGSVSVSPIPRRRLLLLPALVVGGAAACAPDDNDDYLITAWFQGSLPLEERQTIEDYQKTVEPAFGRYVADVAQFSGPASNILQSSLRKGIKGYTLTTATIAFSNPTDYARTCALLLDMFLPMGFEKLPQDKDTLDVLDRRNGGYLDVIDNRERGGIAVGGVSGDRPTSTGRPRENRVVPDWEQAIPLNPKVYPSASATTTPDTPTHNKATPSRARWFRGRLGRCGCHDPGQSPVRS